MAVLAVQPYTVSGAVVDPGWRATFETCFLNATAVPARGDPPCGPAVFRFTLRLWDVEELLVQRGVEVSYETIRLT